LHLLPFTSASPCILTSASPCIYCLSQVADGFFGQNKDYSEDIDRLELDIIEAIQGGCNKRELKSNDFVKILKQVITIAFLNVFSPKYTRTKRKDY
jgi:hypothetical protein